MSHEKSDTTKKSYNVETIEIYTVVLDQKWNREFYRDIGYPIVPPSKLYENNQVTMKKVLKYRITPRYRPLDVLIASIHKSHLCKTCEMVDTRSNMQLAYINSKPHGG